MGVSESRRYFAFQHSAQKGTCLEWNPFHALPVEWHILQVGSHTHRPKDTYGPALPLPFCLLP